MGLQCPSVCLLSVNISFFRTPLYLFCRLFWNFTWWDWTLVCIIAQSSIFRLLVMWSRNEVENHIIEFETAVCMIAAYHFFDFRSRDTEVWPDVQNLVYYTSLIIESPDFKLHRIILNWRMLPIVRCKFPRFSVMWPRNEIKYEKCDSHNRMHFSTKYVSPMKMKISRDDRQFHSLLFLTVDY